VPRGRQFASRGPQRQYIWSDIIVATGGQTQGGGKTVGTFAPIGVETSGVTLVRTRGHGMLHFDPANIADLMHAGFGLGVYSSDAFGIGATAMPGPVTDADYDWIWHSIYTLGPASVSTELDDVITGNVAFEVDSKAMRKLKPNQTIGWMVEGAVVNGGGVFDFSVAVRQLFKLG